MSHLLTCVVVWPNLPAMAATVVISGLWQGIALTTVIWLLLRLIPGTSAAVRFAIWATVFAVLWALPIVNAYKGGFSGNGLQASAIRVDVRWSYLFVAAWLVASLVRLTGLLMSIARLRGIWSRAIPEDEFAQLSVSAGMRKVQVCTSIDVERPSVIGFFSPRILIPPGLFHQLETRELEQIIFHELGHLRRRDDWINLLQKIGLVLLPLNPALLWVDRRMCFERELACDDSVLARTKAPKAYAQCLTKLAETRLGRRAAALSLGAWERQSELVQRVERILGGDWRMGRSQTRILACAMLVAVTGSAAELVRCPQLVSFSSPSTVVGSMASGAYRPAALGDAMQGTGMAKETLLKASMPMNRREDVLTGDGVVRPKSPKALVQAKAVRKAKRPSMIQPVIRTVRRAQLSRPDRAVMILSTWEQATPVPVLVTEDGIVVRGSYAAVTMAGGWIVFQL